MATKRPTIKKNEPDGFVTFKIQMRRSDVAALKREAERRRMPAATYARFVLVEHGIGDDTASNN